MNTKRTSAEQAEGLHIEYLSEQDARDAVQRLQELVVGDEPLLEVERTGQRIWAGCRFRDAGMQDRPVIRKSDGACQRFRELFQRGLPPAARYHPEGFLWIGAGRPQVHRARAPLAAVAPTILAHFGVIPPATMHEPPLPIDRPVRQQAV